MQIRNIAFGPCTSTAWNAEPLFRAFPIRKCWAQPSNAIMFMRLCLHANGPMRVILRGKNAIAIIYVFYLIDAYTLLGRQTRAKNEWSLYSGGVWCTNNDRSKNVAFFDALGVFFFLICIHFPILHWAWPSQNVCNIPSMAFFTRLFFVRSVLWVLCTALTNTQGIYFPIYLG